MKYKTLKETVLYHNNLYYVLARPEISDSEYDKLYDQLVQLEKSQGYRDYDSPTLKVGSLNHRQGKVKHPNRLYSLNKTYSEDEIPGEFTVKTPKLDGACVAIHCLSGKVVSVLSRGDGEYGENISFLFKDLLNNFQLKDASYQGSITIVCEAIKLEPIDNYRNYVAGALNLKSTEEFRSRNLVLAVHDVLGINLPYIDRLNYVRSEGLYSVYHDQDILKNVPKDGYVFRTNDPEVEKRLGHTSKYPKFAIALKERGTETANSLLIDVIWSIGRTGMVNPTGIINPVIIGGATVSKLTLHNLAFIEENDICIGDEIQIERAGEIIPKYVSTIRQSPIRIKITQQHAEEGIQNSVIRVGPRLFVADRSVNDEKVLLNFITQMDIQGLGPASIKKLGLTHISDLYKEQPWDSLGANGSKIKQEIEYSKTKPYERVLAGLGIPSVGLSLAKKIVAVLPKFSDLPKIEYEKIDKVGPKITEKILIWYEENESWVKQLPVALESQVTTTPIDKPIVVLTGTLDRTRKEMTSILEKKGYEVKNSVTKSTYALITDGKEESSKTVAAKKYGIKIVNYFDNKQTVLAGIF